MKTNLRIGVLALALGVVVPTVAFGQGPGFNRLPSPGNAPSGRGTGGYVTGRPEADEAPPPGDPGYLGASPTIPIGGGPPPAPGVSDWLQYNRGPGCCGPVGGDGQIVNEVFVRPGAMVPFGGGVFGRILDVGFSVEAGGRSLLFDTSRTNAVALEIGIGTAWWNAGSERTVFQQNPTRNAAGELTGFTLQSVTPSSLNQTWLQASVGQEFYHLGSADCKDGGVWRTGYDVGGHWGSAKVVLKEIPHKTDVVGTAYFALHTDYEFKYKCATIVTGVRGELGYTWSDILHTNSDFHYGGLMANFGIKY